MASKEIKSALLICEAWDTELHTAPEDKGMWDGWTLAELRQEADRLRDKNDKDSEELKRERQVLMAIRAKQKDQWGKVFKSKKKKTARESLEERRKEVKRDIKKIEESIRQLRSMRLREKEEKEVEEVTLHNVADHLDELGYRKEEHRSTPYVDVFKRGDKRVEIIKKDHGDAKKGDWSIIDKDGREEGDEITKHGTLDDLIKYLDKKHSKKNDLKETIVCNIEPDTDELEYSIYDEDPEEDDVLLDESRKRRKRIEEAIKRRKHVEESRKRRKHIEEDVEDDFDSYDDFADDLYGDDDEDEDVDIHVDDDDILEEARKRRHRIEESRKRRKHVEESRKRRKHVEESRKRRMEENCDENDDDIVDTDDDIDFYDDIHLRESRKRRKHVDEARESVRKSRDTFRRNVKESDEDDVHDKCHGCHRPLEDSYRVHRNGKKYCSHDCATRKHVRESDGDTDIKVVTPGKNDEMSLDQWLNEP